MKGRVVTEASDDLLEVIARLESETLLALDCEGVDLGREGAVCIVQLSTREICFLFDVHGLDSSSHLVVSLKPILESTEILKIIHDPKMDGDALFHQYDITLANVHDTQAWDFVINRSERNLNDTLIAFGCAENTKRLGNVYATNIAYWATRPLTREMIDWASGDVVHLFQLFDAQRRTVSGAAAVGTATERSESQVGFLRNKLYLNVLINPRLMGRFIGPKGANIRILMRSTPGSFFQSRGGNKSGRIGVYAPCEKSLDAAVRSLRPYM